MRFGEIVLLGLRGRNLLLRVSAHFLDGLGVFRVGCGAVVLGSCRIMRPGMFGAWCCARSCAKRTDTVGAIGKCGFCKRVCFSFLNHFFLAFLMIFKCCFGLREFFFVDFIL